MGGSISLPAFTGIVCFASNPPAPYSTARTSIAVPTPMTRGEAADRASKPVLTAGAGWIEGATGGRQPMDSFNKTRNWDQLAALPPKNCSFQVPLGPAI